MRKALVLTCLLLAVSLTAVCAAAIEIYGQRDQVMLTENVLYGDPSAAKGVTVDLHAHYADHLFWNTTCTFGEETAGDTDYSFSAQARRQQWPPIHGGITLYSDPLVGVDMSDDMDISGLEAAYRELLAEIEVGEEGNRTIFLKDYLDYYPLEILINLPGVDVNVQEWEIANEKSDTGLIPGTEAYVVTKLREYFRIPVLETEQYDIHIEKYSQSSIHSWGGGTAAAPESDRYNMSTRNTYTDDACYFTIESHSYNGNLVDLSLLPDGYGLYRLPYGKPRTDEKGVELCGVDVDALEMVYPLNPEIELLGLDVSADQTELLLHAVENGVYSMTVIDLATMETRQILKIADCPEGSAGWQLFNEGDFLLVTLSYTQRLALIDKDESGQYVLRHCWDKQPEELDTLPLAILSGKGYLNATVLDYDGKCLVMAEPLQNRRYELDDKLYKEEICGFLLAVYDESGLAYCGEYVSSLNTGRDLQRQYPFYCRNRDREDLAVTW